MDFIELKDRYRNRIRKAIAYIYRIVLESFVMFSQTNGVPPTSQRFEENLKIRSSIPVNTPVKNNKTRIIMFDAA